MKILIIDDDKIMLKYIEHVLQQDGYETCIEQDAFNAMGVINSWVPDLIICDVLMPYFSGLNLLSVLKRLYYNKTPLILISSLKKSDMILWGIATGAESFIGKPFTENELSMRVKKVLYDKGIDKHTFWA